MGTTLHSDNWKNSIGIIPAAGKGSRLQTLRCPKELLTIGFASDGSNLIRPFLTAEYSLLALKDASVPRCLVVIADWKTELLRYLGDGAVYGVNLAYVNQTEPEGLAAAVTQALPWCCNTTVCLTLPDSVYRPRNAIAQLLLARQRHQADLSLGVFSTPTPERFAPVEYDYKNRVLRVLEKPKSSQFMNTWGVAVWSPSFSEFLKDFVASGTMGPDTSISWAFDAAIRAGLEVNCIPYPDSAYLDAGTPEGLFELVHSTWRLTFEADRCTL